MKPKPNELTEGELVESHWSHCNKSFVYGNNAAHLAHLLGKAFGQNEIARSSNMFD